MVTWLASLCLLLALSPGVAPHPHQIQGVNRKIRLYIRNAYLQLGPGHRVTGSQDDTSLMTVLQRTSVTVGKVKIQGVANCFYLCMDTCGIPYASKEYWDECVFNEVMESDHYNTYTSAKYSNGRRTLYLALGRGGEPRRVQTRAGAPLGRLAAYTRALPQPAGHHTGGGRCRSPPHVPPRPRPAAATCPRPRRQCPRPPCTRQRPRLRHPRKHRKHRTLPEDEPDDDDDLLE